MLPWVMPPSPLSHSQAVQTEPEPDLRDRQTAGQAVHGPRSQLSAGWVLISVVIVSDSIAWRQ